MPLYVAVIDLTKAFDLISRDGLFKILNKTPKLDMVIPHRHERCFQLQWCEARLSLLQHSLVCS